LLPHANDANELAFFSTTQFALSPCRISLSDYGMMFARHVRPSSLNHIAIGPACGS
jgi:hypothetical protein